MTTTLVTGATGTLGAPTVTRLRAAGHDVRALGRRSGPDLTSGDLLTGAGVQEAVRATGTPRPVMPMALPGKVFAACRAGSALVPGPAYGRLTFADHLAARAGALR